MISRHHEICELAIKHGFKNIYFVRHTENVTIILLLFPYTPYAADIHIPANYIANNASYFAKKKLLLELGEIGIAAEDVFVPIKPLAAAAGIGSICLNGLLHIDGFGTRMAMHTLAISALDCPPMEYCACKKACDSCGACITECPFNAINENGVDYGKCMRSYMNDAAHSDEIKSCFTTYMGCERCQAVCHLNKQCGVCEVPADILAAFEIKRLIGGDTKAARLLVGKNFTGNGKLTAEAIVFAARDGVLTPELCAIAEKSSFPAVHDALRWAKERYSI